MVMGARLIGLMGGTFDPIHYGHLLAAENARQAFGLEKVCFVPAGNPPHKKGGSVAAADRYAMTEIATLSNPHFDVSAVELDRAGDSHTIDTLREFNRRYPEAEFYFITGADAVLDLPTWKEPEALLTHAVFIAVARPGYPAGKLERLCERLPADLAERIVYLEIPGLAIASRDLRRRVAAGRTIKYLVPESVEAYIAKRRLYLTEQQQ